MLYLYATFASENFLGKSAVLNFLIEIHIKEQNLYRDLSCDITLTSFQTSDAIGTSLSQLLLPADLAVPDSRPS